MLRKRIINFTFAIFFFQSASVFSAPTTEPKKKSTLADLDAYIDRYQNFTEFLDDATGLQAYRDLLKSYMGYDESFDPIFKATVEQMKVLNLKIPEFDSRIWKNSAQLEAAIIIEGSRSQRSGIETDRSVLEQGLTDSRDFYFKNAKAIIELPGIDKKKTLNALQDKIIRSLEAIEKKYPEEIRNVNSNSALKRISQDAGKRLQRQNYLNEVKALSQLNTDLKTFTSVLRYRLLQSEQWLDTYRRNFAEDSLAALRSLDTFESSEMNVDDVLKTEFDSLNPKIPALIKNTDRLYLKAEENWNRLQEAKKKINQLLTPREPPELVQELQQIEARNPGFNPYQARQLLGERGKRLLQEFSKQRLEIYLKKQEILKLAHDQSLYRLPVVEDHEKIMIELRRQSSDAFTLRPMHAIHAAFAGRKTKECVGGGDACALTPRRWALSALEGVRTYAAEKAEDFDGTLKLVKVRTSDDSEQFYEAVDMMINSVASTIEIRSALTGQSAKYPLFDAILDRLTLLSGSIGFVAGDGQAISQNTGLAKVYSQSPAVVAATKLSDTSKLEPTDRDLSVKINKEFPSAPYGYNLGGMIFEGMPGDGGMRFVLRPRDRRPKYALKELEGMLLADFISTRSVAQSHAWSLAVENDIKLKSLSEYQSLNFDSETLREALRALANNPNSLKRSSMFTFLGSDQAKQIDPAIVRDILTLDVLRKAATDLNSASQFYNFLASDVAKYVDKDALIGALTEAATFVDPKMASSHPSLNIRERIAQCLKGAPGRNLDPSITAQVLYAIAASPHQSVRDLLQMLFAFEPLRNSKVLTHALQTAATRLKEGVNALKESLDAEYSDQRSEILAFFRLVFWTSDLLKREEIAGIVRQTFSLDTLKTIATAADPDLRSHLYSFLGSRKNSLSKPLEVEFLEWLATSPKWKNDRKSNWRSIDRLSEKLVGNLGNSDKRESRAIKNLLGKWIPDLYSRNTDLKVAMKMAYENPYARSYVKKLQRWALAHHIRALDMIGLNSESSTGGFKDGGNIFSNCFRSLMDLILSQ